MKNFVLLVALASPLWKDGQMFQYSSDFSNENIFSQRNAENSAVHDSIFGKWF